MSKIKRDSWAIIERIIRRYPDNKKEYEEYIEEIMSSSGSSTEGEIGESVQCSSVEAKAMKMNSAKMERIKREINAVEYVYKNLVEEHQKVMRKRYWSNRWKNIPFTKMVGVSYSETQMRRIVYRIISQIGSQLGEID